MFAIGRSTVSVVLRDVVHDVNESLRAQILWPRGDRLRDVEEKFHDLCGLPGVVGAIDGTHFAISKPSFGAADYYYFKSGGYTINCQAAVDSERRFIDLYLGMPGLSVMRACCADHLYSIWPCNRPYWILPT